MSNFQIFYNACAEGRIHYIKSVIKNVSFTWWDAGLYGACRGGHLGIVEFMIEKGATDYDSGLSVASRYDRLNIVKLLIEKGATHINTLSRKQMYRTLEMGLSQSLIKSEKFQELLNNIQIFQKQTFDVANRSLISDLANLVANYSLK